MWWGEATDEPAREDARPTEIPCGWWPCASTCGWCVAHSRAPFWQRETGWRREPLYAGIYFDRAALLAGVASELDLRFSV